MVRVWKSLVVSVKTNGRSALPMGMATMLDAGL
jgi:hypothetical protein